MRSTRQQPEKNHQRHMHCRDNIKPTMICVKMCSCVRHTHSSSRDKEKINNKKKTHTYTHIFYSSFQHSILDLANVYAATTTLTQLLSQPGPLKVWFVCGLLSHVPARVWRIDEAPPHTQLAIHPSDENHHFSHAHWVFFIFSLSFILFSFFFSSFIKYIHIVVRRVVRILLPTSHVTLFPCFLIYIYICISVYYIC